MNYELAKKLKDTGLVFEYPQTRENTLSYLDSENNPCDALGKDAAYIPTLSELIEACGDRLDGISRMKEGKQVDWYAYCRSDASGLSSGITECSGSTPKKLWRIYG